MTHISENSNPLVVKHISISSTEDLHEITVGYTDVCMLILPSCAKSYEYNNPLKDIGAYVAGVAGGLSEGSTLIVIGETIDLVQAQAAMPDTAQYQHIIVLKRTVPKEVDARSLPNYHYGALVQTRYHKSLRHIKTRIEYTYCPTCDKTTKDYGGKKHTYHSSGTLMSDVWHDIQCDLESDLSPVVNRFQDLFGIDPYKELLVLDCRSTKYKRAPAVSKPVYDLNKGFVSAKSEEVKTLELRQALPQTDMFVRSTHCGTNAEITEGRLPKQFVNQILHGDCIEWLREMPTDSIDFIFTDPPYNLRKKYSGYSDDLEIRKYFDWCDEWIAELSRVLKPGRTLTLLNIPLWAIRHFVFMDSVLEFQNWIVWDALAFPVRMIMPAHYSILAFTKGVSRELPGLTGESEPTDVASSPDSFMSLQPLAEGFCLRSKCIRDRLKAKIHDRGMLTDLWWDIHRLKHNSRRVDHPTQLPPHLMYRLIAIFSKRNEIVLDCFNGAGTTTLTAHQLDRQYIGIENSKEYCDVTVKRHEELLKGLNPFRKVARELTAKNSPVPRLPIQKYKVPKKTLQMEVKRVASELGHIPTRAELSQHGKYPIRYYDEYFISWGEVCAAARTTGMNEDRPAVNDDDSEAGLLKQMSMKLNESE